MTQRTAAAPPQAEPFDVQHGVGRDQCGVRQRQFLHPLGVPHGIRGIERAIVLEVKSPAQAISEFPHISDT